MDGLTNTSPNAKPASDVQQKQFDLLLGRAREMMGFAGEEWISAIKTDPIMAAVTMGTQTLREMAMASEKAGQKVDPAVLLHVGIQFVKDIAAVANAAGSVSDEELPNFLKEVMSQSMAEYLRMDAEDGLLSKEDEARAKQVIAQSGSPAEPAPQEAAPAPMPEADDPEMAAELMAIRKAKGGM